MTQKNPRRNTSNVITLNKRSACLFKWRQCRSNFHPSSDAPAPKVHPEPGQLGSRPEVLPDYAQGGAGDGAGKESEQGAGDERVNIDRVLES